MTFTRNRQPQLRYLLAVDPSLSASGWVWFDLCTERPLAAGVVTPPGPKYALADRLCAVQETVNLLYRQLGLSSVDIVVCEGPAPLVLNPESSLKVEQVRSIFESVARSTGAQVPGRLNPRTVQTELLGLRGKQLCRAEVKRSAREASRQLFGAALEKVYFESAGARRVLPQDVIDAALVGFVALSRVKLAVQCDRDLSVVFAGRLNGDSWGSRRRSAGWRSDCIKPSVR